MTNPPDYANLHCLFRADAGLYSDLSGTTPATADGTAVALWQDQSDNLNHLGQSTSGSRPLFKTNQINTSMPCVRFDGADDHLLFQNAFTVVNRTMYAVVRIAGTGTYTIVSGRPLSLQWRLDAQKQRLVQAGTADIGLGSGAIALNTWTQVNASWDLSNGVFRKAGAADGSVALANVGGGVLRAVGGNVGGGGTLSEFFAQDLFLFALFNGVHDTTTRQAHEAWLSSELGGAV